ncbi:MAG: DUF4402 domain-containing protein [Fusobacterium sp. JB021]|nr:DUF4402 domain-containing protein [Fusobacterium sp. JB021]MDP0507032.1 DUF4402 domain-containing protein [Fusobacterium sp. JB019]
MKKTLLGLFLGLSVMSMAAEVKVGENVSGDLNINANVIAPLSIAEEQAMDFGDIVLGEKATSTTPGKMTVTGAAGNSVTISFPDTTTISRVGVDNSTATVNLTSLKNGIAQTLDDEGHLTEVINGVIDKGQTTKTGVHTGTVTVSVMYN